MTNIKEMTLQDLERKFLIWNCFGMVDEFADMFWTEFSQS